MKRLTALDKVKDLTLYTGTFGREKCTCNCIGCTQGGIIKEKEPYQGNINQIKKIINKLPNLENAYLLGNPDISVDTDFCNEAAKEFERNNISVMFSTSGYGGNKTIKRLVSGLNFISVFIIGGFILSGITQRESDNFEARYPYGYIIWGDEINLQEKYTYHFLQAETEENKKAIIFSTSTYEDITKNEISVSDGKIVYISQRSRETFEPLEGKAQLNIIVNNNMKTYDIETSRWQIIFGDSISPELTNVIIMNDKDYEKIKKNESEIYLGNTAENLTEENTHKWMRKEAIRTEREGNDYVVFIMYIIGIMLIFEEQGIVLIKQILNRSRILYKYNLLYILGIQNKDLKKFFFNEIKTIAIFPLVSGSLVGMFFLCLDIFYQNDFTWDVLNLCLSLCGIMILVQYLGFRCISTLLFKIYNIGRTER